MRFEIRLRLVKIEIRVMGDFLGKTSIHTNRNTFDDSLDSLAHVKKKTGFLRVIGAAMRKIFVCPSHMWRTELGARMVGFPPNQNSGMLHFSRTSMDFTRPQLLNENCLFQEAANGVDGAEGGKGWRLC